MPPSVLVQSHLEHKGEVQLAWELLALKARTVGGEVKFM